MEAQMHRPHGVHEEQPQPAGTGLHSGEDHEEKKSVLKKVKAKAKRIKDSVKHLGHGHEHEGEEEEEEEDEDEEIEPEAELHGAPIYDSSFIHGTALPRQDVGLGPTSAMKGVDNKATNQDTILRQGQAGFGLAKPTTMESHVPEYVPPASGMSGTETDPISHTSNVPGHEGNVNVVEPGPRIGAPAGLETDPDAPKLDRFEEMQPSNDESKVTGGGGEEARIDPLISSFGKMEVKDESEMKPTVLAAGSEHKQFTGSHDQFAPQPQPQHIPMEGQFPGSEHEPFTGSHEQFAPQEGQSAPRTISHNPSEASENPDTIPKSFDASKPEELPRDPIDEKSSGQGSYAGKISSAITGSAISAKNAVASKLGYGSPEAVKSEVVDEGKPAGQQGSYTDTISYATSAIADKAAAAKNVVASKLGYTGTEPASPRGTEPEPTTESAKSASPSSQTGYAQKTAAVVTEKLAPVYGAVAGVGSSVMSKAPGVGTGSSTTSSHEGKPRGTDKGASMKEYIAEKFRPGEEDKALSEVISETLYKQKETTPGESKPPIERVTESEEVKRRLGTGKENQREGEDAIKAGSESSGGGGVMDRITGAVSSWIKKGGGSGGGGGESQTSQGGGGGGGESQTSQGSPGTIFVNTKDSSAE